MRFVKFSLAPIGASYLVARIAGQQVVKKDNCAAPKKKNRLH